MNDTQTETKAFKGMKRDLTRRGNFKLYVGGTYEIDPKNQLHLVYRDFTHVLIW
jgi:hypothetical protein